MNLKRLPTLCFLCVLLAMPVLLTGCLFGGGSPRAWNVSLVKKTPATITVDLIGVSKSDKSDWAGYDLNKYWSPGDFRRKEADKVTFENLEEGVPVTLSIKDPQWDKWFSHGATELLVIAYLPGNWPGGADDPRRKFLPLSRKDWDAKKNTLEIEIQNTRIHVLTPQINRD